MKGDRRVEKSFFLLTDPFRRKHIYSYLLVGSSQVTTFLPWYSNRYPYTYKWWFTNVSVGIRKFGQLEFKYLTYGQCKRVTLSLQSMGCASMRMNLLNRLGQDLKVTLSNIYDRQISSDRRALSNPDARMTLNYINNIKTLFGHHKSQYSLLSKHLSVFANCEWYHLRTRHQLEYKMSLLPSSWC